MEVSLKDTLSALVTDDDLLHLKDKDFAGHELEIEEDEDDACIETRTEEHFPACTEALAKLSEIQATETQSSRSRKGQKRKRTSQRVYGTIIDGLKAKAIKVGFSDEELHLMWKIASNPDLNLNCLQRRNLMFLMLPTAKVSRELVEAIVHWLKDATSRSVKPSVVVGAYQLLNLYVEFRLIEDDEIMNELLLTRIILTKTDNFVIPWKMRLFRNLATPQILTPLHVKELKKLERTKDAKKTHVDDVRASLAICKYLCPGLLVNEDPIARKVRELNFPIDALTQFHQCSVRIQAGASNLHPLADRIFPEFLPNSFKSSRLAVKNVRDQMLECLESEYGITKLALHPVLLNAFEQWLRPMLHCRFHVLPGPVRLTDDELRRYIFMFERCLMLTEIKLEGLSVVNEWICNVLGIWDNRIYKNFLVKLIPYLGPADVLLRKDRLQKSLVSRFFHWPCLRYEMWDALEEIYDSWIKVPSYSAGLEWLINIMEICVTSVVFSFDHDQENTNLLIRVCMFYLKMQCSLEEITQNFLGKLNLELFRMPNALLGCLIFRECVENFQFFAEAINNRSRATGAEKLEDNTEDFVLGVNCIHAGVFPPDSMENSLFREIRIESSMDFEKRFENVHLHMLENLKIE